MIQQVRNGIELSFGGFLFRITDVAIGTGAIKKYNYFQEQIGFIESDKVKIWILTKMIKGLSFEDALNAYFNKWWVTDKDWRNLV